MKLDGMTYEELEKLQNQVEVAKLQAKRLRLVEAKDGVLKLLDDLGVSLDEVLPELTGKGSTGGTKPSKYVHPNDPTLRWSGHGRRPNWYLELLEKGVTEEQLLL